jgi:hypothetical protein
MHHAAVLVLIGDTDLLCTGTRPAGSDVVTLVTLPASPASTGPANTLILTLAGASSADAETRTIDGTRRITPAGGGDLMAGLQPGTAISQAITALPGTCPPARHAPLFCAARHPGGWHVYSRTDQHPGRWCFIRTSPHPMPATTDNLSWLNAALTLHATHARTINNRDYPVPPGFAGKEVETKYTLPPGTPIWPLAADTHARITAGAAPGMVPRFGPAFEMHDFDNHLYDVTAPPEHRGYVSFMTIQGGTCWIKRKHFTADALIRAETVSGPVRPGQPLDSYVRDVLGLTARPLPPFRRIRYDVLLESTTTGSHYCILFDRCTLHDAPDETLTQCEIEYVRSRRVLPLDPGHVLEEFAALTAWCGTLLAAHGIAATAGYYSKLSFLRDVIRRRPELGYIP